MEKLGADTEHAGADYECGFEGAVTRCVEHPVEAEGEEEEGEVVECFVVDVRV